MNGERTPKILCLMLASCMAASCVATGAKNSKTQTPADAKKQLLDLEQIWVAAEHNHDSATLQRILDDKFVASFGADKPLDKEAFIRLIVTGDADLTESQTLTDRDVILDHDTAVVVGVDTK